MEKFDKLNPVLVGAFTLVKKAALVTFFLVFLKDHNELSTFFPNFFRGILI